MTADATRWHPGDEHAVVWPGGAALLSAEVSAEAAEWIWHRMRRDGGLADFLEVLAESQGASLLHLPPFAIVLGTAQTCHVAVRGGFEVYADDGEQRRTYTGTGVTTWFEGHLAPRPAQLVLMAGPVSAVGRPIVDGVVAGGALSLGEGAWEAVSEPEPVAEHDPEPQLVDLWAFEAPASRGRVAEQDPELQPADLAEPADNESGADADDGIAAELEEDQRLRETRYDDEHLAAPIIDAVPVEMIPSQPPVESLADPGQDWMGPLLSDESVVMDAEAAAVRLEPREDSSKAASIASGDVIAPDVSPLLGLSANPSDLHDDLTVVDFGARDDAFLGDPSASALEDGAAAIGETPIVLASFCQRGHANPPQRGTCRVCEAPVEARTERTPRPTLGRIRLSSGETVELTGSILAGRSPRFTTGGGEPPPRLLALPHAHISGNHLEFTLEGWTVLARDLGSRNGSFLRRDGQGVVPLPGRAVPLVDGDIIDLGHGVFLYLEQLP